MRPIESNSSNCHFKKNRNGLKKNERKSRVNLNKPIHIGTSGLNLSKILMKDFHYTDI